MLAIALAASANRTRLDAVSEGKALALYWGQNSAGSQQRLREYCGDSTVDIFVVSFLTTFGEGRDFVVNFANACEPAENPTFPGSTLFPCPAIAEDIAYCQSKGKTILLSLGGAVGNYGLGSDADGQAVAEKLYNVFGKGKSDTRVFGDVAVDGYDLDIESGSATGYAAMVNRLRELDPKVLIGGAPMCPVTSCPAMCPELINSAWFDYLFIQFYNGWCAPRGSIWGDDYDTFNYGHDSQYSGKNENWEYWAGHTSVNPNIRLFFGTPGAIGAAGSGYQGFDKLEKAMTEVTPRDHFGGIMMWDASQAYANKNGGENYAEFAKRLLAEGK